jgi:hypothetical protein
MTCSFSCLNQTWISSSVLLAKWAFDGNFLDQTTSFNATAVVTPSFVTNGYVNEAVWFNSNQYLSTSYIPLSNTSYTIEGWIYPTGYPNTNDHSIIGLCTNPLNNQCLHLTIRKSGLTYHFYHSFFGDNCLGIQNVILFKWTHVAFVFDLTTYAQYIYIDGILDQMCNSATPLLATSGPLTIGYIPGIVAAYGTNFFQVSFHFFSLFFKR